MSKILYSALKEAKFNKSIFNQCLWKQQCLFSSSSSPSAKMVFPKEVDLDKIRQEFRKFEGGQISLSKDEESGIAYICLDHVEKKNGLSGMIYLIYNEL